MSPAAAPAFGQAILAAHLVVIAFNVAGLVAIPVGAKLGWRWVRIRWWRALHLVSWAVVALQAALGRACFLTIWQDDLTGAGGTEPPLIMRFVNSLIYWPLPMGRSRRSTWRCSAWSSRCGGSFSRRGA